MSLIKITQFFSLFNKVKTFKKKLKIQNNYLIKKYNFIIKYIISIIINYSNSFLILKFINYNKQYFYSFKNFKQKYKNLSNNKVLTYYYKIIISKLKKLKHRHIAIHFYNIKFNYRWLINKLAARFFITVLKFYKKISYNGCRKKKLKKQKIKRNG